VPGDARGGDRGDARPLGGRAGQPLRAALRRRDARVYTLRQFADAGFDEVYVQQIGERQAEFFDVLARDVLPRLA
jgi:hypothetical protein